MIPPASLHPMQVVNYMSAGSMTSPVPLGQRKPLDSSNVWAGKSTSLGSKRSGNKSNVVRGQHQNGNKQSGNNRLGRREREQRKYSNHQNDGIFIDTEKINTLGQLMHVVGDHKRLSPGNLSAIWKRLSLLLSTADMQHIQGSELQQREQQLRCLLDQTLVQLKHCCHWQLCKISFGVASVIKSARGCNNRQKKSTDRGVLHSLLVQDKTIRENIFQAIAVAAVPILRKPDGLVTLAYTCATAEVTPISKSGSNLFHHIAEAIINMESKTIFKPHELSKLLWSFAVRGEAHPKLFEKVGNAMVARPIVGSLTPHNLTNVVWAYAASGLTHPVLFGRVADDITYKRDLSSFEAKDLANIVWAFAKTEAPAKRMFAAVAAALGESRGALKVQDLSKVLWAFSTFSLHYPSLFQLASIDLLQRDIERVDTHTLATIVWALSRAKVPAEGLLEHIAGVAAVRTYGFTAQDLANLLHGFASSGVQAVQLFKSMAPRVADILDQFTVQALVTTCWAYAVIGVHSENLFNQDLVDILIENVGTLSSSELRMLYQWHLWQKEEVKGPGLPQELEKLCHDSFIGNKVHASVYHKHIMATLHSLGMDPAEDVMSSRGFRLDALVECHVDDGATKKVSVRVEGPHHFIGRLPTGRTQLRSRQIANVEGITLVSIPYWDWNELGSDRRKQQNYLRREMQFDKP